MPGLRLHERHFIVSRAHLDASAALDAIWSEHGLTYGEIMAFFGKEIASHAKYMVREERHGDASEPGDLSAEK